MTLTDDVNAELVTVPLERTSAAAELATFIRLNGSFEQDPEFVLKITSATPRVLDRLAVLLHE